MNAGPLIIFFVTTGSNPTATARILRVSRFVAQNIIVETLKGYPSRLYSSVQRHPHIINGITEDAVKYVSGTGKVTAAFLNHLFI
jgi:hypothetical protein